MAVSGSGAAGKMQQKQRTLSPKQCRGRVGEKVKEVERRERSWCGVVVTRGPGCGAGVTDVAVMTSAALYGVTR